MLHSKTLHNAWSLLLDSQSSCDVFLVVLGLVPCLRWKMGTKMGRSQSHVRLVGRFSRARTTSLAMFRRSSVVSWSDSPRNQAVSKNVEAVHGGLTGSSSDLERHAG